MVDNPLKLLFIAPNSDLSTHAELARIASGNTVEIVDGLLDRGGLERALRTDAYDALHFAGHGGKSVLALSDGLIDSADFVSMLDGQHGARFAFVNACDSLAVGAAIHNALHIPTIAHDAEIGDKTAVRFAERFYREYKRKQDIGAAFEAARETLIRLYPNEATIPQLINGDMSTHAELSDCMAFVREEIGGMRDKLDNIEAAVNYMRGERDTAMRKTVVIIVALMALQVMAQAVTPWLNSVFAR